MCFFICAQINGWVKNSETGDSRRNRAHYDVTVMARPLVHVKSNIAMRLIDLKHLDYIAMVAKRRFPTRHTEFIFFEVATYFALLI